MNCYKNTLFFGERILVFTEDNRTAYKVSLRYLVPTITRLTPAAERKLILDQFSADGGYTVLCSSEVLIFIWRMSSSSFTQSKREHFSRRNTTSYNSLKSVFYTSGS